MGLLYALCDLTFQDIKKLLKNWLFDKKAVEKLAVEILAVNELAVDKLAVWYIGSVPVEHGDWSQDFFLNEQLWFVFVIWLIWIYFIKCYN